MSCPKGVIKKKHDAPSPNGQHHYPFGVVGVFICVCVCPSVRAQVSDHILVRTRGRTYEIISCRERIGYIVFR